MNQCYVCAASLPNDEAASACPDCATPLAELQHLEKAANRRRFLFGRVQETPAAQTKAASPPPKKPRAKASSAKSKPKPKAKTAPLHRDFEEAGAGNDLDRAITNRDAVDLPPPEPELPFYLRGGAHLIDVIACILLNLWVFKLILWMSPRNFTALVTFSLIPLLFVMLCFTALYFYLFIGLLKRSLGQIIMEILTGSKNNAPPSQV